MSNLAAHWRTGAVAWLHRLGQAPVLKLNLPARTDPAERAPLSIYFVLLALCLVPRLWMAHRIRVICPDATNYVHAAQMLEEHGHVPELESIKYNTLTGALLVLHRCGLEWETAGKLWNVTLATLAVLPLFGWARRQFNYRIGLLTAILYATHPGLIENSAEILRDPGFWFFFLAALYLFWRAAMEGGCRFFLAGGVAVVAAILTRFEGFALVIPISWWLMASWWSAPALRLRLTLGVLALAAMPALFVLVAVVALPNSHPTEWIRLDPLQRAGIWLQRFGSVSPGTTAAERAVSTVDTGNLLKNYVVTIARGFDPLVALLLPASLFGWRGLWLRRDVIPLVLLAACVLFASWIHLSFAHLMSSRYALPAFLALSPLCALGAVWPAERRGLRMLPRTAFGQGVALLLLVGGLASVGLVDALGSNFRGREQQAQVGRWLQARYGQNMKISAPAHNASILMYYAHGCTQPIGPTTPTQLLFPAITSFLPDVVVLDRTSTELKQQLLAFTQLDLHPLPESALPRAARQFSILVKGPITADELHNAMHAPRAKTVR